MEEGSARLERLFNPRSVAVIGASNNINKWGNSTFANIVKCFEGPVYPVNPRDQTVMGHRAYRSVLDIEGEVDLAVFVIQAPAVPQAMRECVLKGVPSGVIISAGFRETGPDGRRLEDEVLAEARKGGLRFVGPNCMGMWSATSKLSAYMFALPSMDGPAAFVTQGGNVGGSIVASAFERGLGFRRYVSCGPAADIQLEDYIAYFGQDDGVKVILAYVEGVADGRRFIETVRKVTRVKPVIVHKPGRSEAVAKAILSHSGALSGHDEIFDSAVKKAGAVRVHTPEELLDTAIGFLTQPLPKGRRVGIITGGGSYGVICADDCAAAGLEVPELPAHAIDALSGIFPPRWSHGNPVDPAGDRNFIAYYLAPKLIMELGGIDALIFMGFGNLAGISRLLRTGGQKLFVHYIPELLSGLGSGTGLKDQAVEALLDSNVTGFTSLVDPLLGFIAEIFGSDIRTVKAFVDILVSSDRMRKALAQSIEDFFGVVQGESPGLEKLLELLDGMIATLLRLYVITYEKPILSTSFSETPQPIKGSTHVYTSSTRAVNVLARLAQYREYLEDQGVFRGPMQCCTLLCPEGGGTGSAGVSSREVPFLRKESCS